MNDPLNMPCARVCLSRLSPKDLPPNALEQFYFYATEKKKASDTSLWNKEETSRGSHYFVNHFPLVNRCGDKSKKDISSFAIRSDHVYQSIGPSYSKEHSRSITDRERWKAQGSVPAVSNINKLFGAVLCSPVTPVSCVQSCSTKDLNAFAWKHKTQEAIIDSRVNRNKHFSDLSAAACLSPGEVPGLQQENDGTKNLITGKDKYDFLGLSPVTTVCKKHDRRQSTYPSSYAEESNSKARLFPTHFGPSRRQCANNNESEERREENLSGEAQHSKTVTIEWGRNDSCYNNNAQKSKTLKYERDMANITNTIYSTCELDATVSRPLPRMDYEPLSRGTIISSSALEEDGCTRAGETKVLNFSASCSSLSDHPLYEDKCFWLQDGGSYSPPESRESSVEKSTSYFSSQENRSLELRRSKETFDKIVLKKRIEIPPVEINISHVDTPAQSTKPEAASTSLDNSVHLRNANARPLLGASRGLLTPEIKLVPLDIRGKTIISANRVLNKPSNRGKLSRGEGLSPKHNLVVKIVDLGNNVHPPGKTPHSSVSQVKEQYTNFGRRIPNYCEAILAKENINDLPTPNKRHKRKRKSQGRAVPIDTKDSVVKKENKQRKQDSKDPTARKAKIPKQYKNTKFSEIQTIRGIKMRYKVAFAKWPDVFTGALNTINQRMVSQNTLLHFLRKEESNGSKKPLPECTT